MDFCVFDIGIDFLFIGKLRDRTSVWDTKPVRLEHKYSRWYLRWPSFFPFIKSWNKIKNPLFWFTPFQYVIAYVTNFIDIDASTDNNTLNSVLASYYVAIKADVLLLTKRNNKNTHRKNTNWNHPFADHRSQTISLEKKILKEPQMIELIVQQQASFSCYKLPR
jgi:hypothetical protein